MLIGAGADTTSGVLQTFFKIMALQPAAVKKAHEGDYLPLEPIFNS